MKIKKEQLFKLLKTIDKFLINKESKEDFLNYDTTSIYHLTGYLEKLGMNQNEVNYLMGVYNLTYKNKYNDPTIDDIILPKKQKYKVNYRVYITGPQGGYLVNNDKYYSPQEAIYDYHENRNFEHKLVWDETDWDEFDVSDPEPLEK